MNHRPRSFVPPPLWLASALVVAGLSALYDIANWVILFLRQPVHPDFRIFYVAAEAGVRFGWASSYDLTILRSLSKSFPAGQTYVDSGVPFINPPVLAWLIAPLTIVPLPAAYALWTALLLAALVWAWHIAAPYTGLKKFALLLLALALWPVLDAFYFGQPSTLLLALVATSWWLCTNDRPIAAGATLALATALKPHTLILVPLALAASGRYRAFIGWLAVGGLLAAACVLALGASGLDKWWRVAQYGQLDPGQARYTLGYVLGTGPISYGLEALQGAAAVLIAWRRRAEVNVVFAAGLVGSLAFAFHLHQYDYVALILAGWLVVRTEPPLWHRLWLLAGVVTLQTIDLGQPIPQLIWDAGWLVILGMGGPSALTKRRLAASWSRSPPLGE